MIMNYFLINITVINRHIYVNLIQDSSTNLLIQPVKTVSYHTYNHYWRHSLYH